MSEEIIKEKTWIVLNPNDSTYRLIKSDSAKTLAKALGTDPSEVHIEGSYVKYKTPEYQAILLADQTVFNFD